jgi:hypothetical protein
MSNSSSKARHDQISSLRRIKQQHLTHISNHKRTHLSNLRISQTRDTDNAAGRNEESDTATHTWRVAGRLYLSIIPAGTAHSFIIGPAVINTHISNHKRTHLSNLRISQTRDTDNAAGRNEEIDTATHTWRVAGRLYLSIIPAGTRDTLTQTRTHAFGLVDTCGLQQYYGGRGRCQEGHPQRHHQQLPREHRQGLPDLAPKHRPTDHRQTCLYVVHRCQGRPTL